MIEVVYWMKSSIMKPDVCAVEYNGKSYECMLYPQRDGKREIQFIVAEINQLDFSSKYERNEYGQFVYMERLSGRIQPTSKEMPPEISFHIVECLNDIYPAE